MNIKFKKYTNCSILLFAIITSAFATNKLIYKIYHNARFNYSITYPSQLLFEQGESENGDGQKFLSKNKKAQLTVWGSHFPEHIDDNYSQTIQQYQKTGRVTYSLLKKNTFSISGTQENDIFYQKTVYQNEKNVNFVFTYPKNEKTFWNNIAAKLHNSLKIY